MTSIELIPAHADDVSCPPQWLRLGVQDSPVEDFSAAVADILGQVTRPPRDERWGAFWTTEIIRDQVRAVGLCSFETEPNDLREVEIAYYTFPHCEGRGIATAAVRELTKRASRHVSRVIAHTLPIENASCKVLRRCDYQLAGEVIDPEDGLVWRWHFPTGASSDRWRNDEWCLTTRPADQSCGNNAPTSVVFAGVKGCYYLVAEPCHDGREASGSAAIRQNCLGFPVPIGFNGAVEPLSSACGDCIASRAEETIHARRLAELSRD